MRRYVSFPPLIRALLLAAFLPASLRAGWVENGVPVCADSYGNHARPAMAPDGSGGFIVAWEDDRSGSSIYAQRINSYGNALWAPDGVVVCAAGGGFASRALVVPDGNGGAVIVWQDSRSGDADIYSQRVDASGSVRWAANGVPVCAAPGDQTAARAIFDGAGGAVVAWVDARNGGSDIYAARLTPDGAAPWGANGMLVCGSPGNQYGIDLAPDGLHGAYFSWSDPRGSYHAIYAQWIDANGICHWTLNGLPVATSAHNQIDPRMIPDGAGGFIVCWMEYRTTSYDLFAQRMNLYRTRLWTDAGVAVCAAPDRQRAVSVASDGSSGAVFAWEDERGDTTDVFAQRIDSTGAARWTANGIAVCAAAAPQRAPLIVPDGDAGAVVSWIDERADTGSAVYAQGIDSTGASKWAQNGEPLCEYAGAVDPRPCMASDGDGGCYVAWDDLRDGAYIDVYAQRMDRFGSWGHPAPVASSALAAYLSQNFPNPFNPSTRIEFGLSYPATARLRIYDASGRLVRAVASGFMGAGRHEALWDGRDDAGRALPSGVYFCRLDAGTFSATRKLVLLK